MRILYDLLSAQSTDSKFHGGGEYIKTVFYCLVETYSSEIVVFKNPKLFMDDWVLGLIERKSIRFYDVKDYDEVEDIFKKEVIDVFYSGLVDYVSKIKIPNNVIKIGTIHGLRLLEIPTDRYESKFFDGFFSIKKKIKFYIYETMRNRAVLRMKESMKSLDKIICVSNHTKYAIMNFFPDFSHKLHMYYTPSKFVRNKQFEENPYIEGKYILLLGVNRWIKNGYRAIQAVDSLFARGYLKDYRLVTIGTVSRKLKRLMTQIGKYVLLDYVEAEILENLYKNCDIFFYPTLNEGFGMPPLEAMKYGKTCVVSGICSLPEICGDAVYYFNPYDMNEIQNRLLMASERKIDPILVDHHLKVIEEKQLVDLKGVCEFIMNGGKM